MVVETQDDLVVLQLSRYHSNTSVLIGLDWPSTRERVLIRKLKLSEKVG